MYKKSRSILVAKSNNSTFNFDYSDLSYFQEHKTEVQNLIDAWSDVKVHKLNYRIKSIAYTLVAYRT